MTGFVLQGHIYVWYLNIWLHFCNQNWESMRIRIDKNQTIPNPSQKRVRSRVSPSQSARGICSSGIIQRGMCVLRQVRCGGPGPGLSRVGPSRRRGSWAWFGPRTEHHWVGEGWGRTRSCRPASSCAEGDWAAGRGCPAGPDVAWARAPGGRQVPRAAEARWEDEGRCSSAHHPGTALEQLKQLKPTASGFITHLRTHYSYTTCCLLSALTTAWLTDITTCKIKWAL